MLEFLLSYLGFSMTLSSLKDTLAFIKGIFYNITRVWPFGVSTDVLSDQQSLCSLAGRNSGIQAL